MKSRNGWRIIAACIACALVISTPVLADVAPEISGAYQREIEEVSKDQVKQRVEESLEKVLGYIQKNVPSPIVGSIGGEWAVMAMERNGRLSQSASNEYIKNLLHELDEKDGILSKVKYTEYSRVVMALTSMGMDPSNIGGYHLLQPLADFKKVCVQGINGPVFALIAFDTNKYDIPAILENQKGEQTTRDGLIQYILESQLPDGGWGLTDQPDDMTPMAIQALAPYYSRPEVKKAVDRALDLWSTFQKADGGFGEAGGSETISQTIIALCALNKDLIYSEQFTKAGHTLIDGLLKYQKQDGSFQHTSEGASDGMSSEQAALALTAYHRSEEGKTRLYDMTDVASKQDGKEQIESIKTVLQSLKKHLDLDDKDQVYSLLAQLEKMGDFDGRTEIEKDLETLKEELERQQEEIKTWDQDMWTMIDPQNITIQDKEKVIQLRERYEKIPNGNRKYLENAEDLIFTEEEILKIENGSNILAGLKEEDIQQEVTQSQDHKIENVETFQEEKIEKESQKQKKESIVKDGIVSSQEFENIKGKDKNLKFKWKLETGEEYKFTINGQDIKEVKDFHVNIIKGSHFEEEIKMLSEDPYMFYFEEEEFPGQMQVEFPVDLEDGEYLLLKYDNIKRKAQYIQKVEVKDQYTKFIISEGGDYFIAKKAYSKSLDDLEKGEEIEEQDILLAGMKEPLENKFPVAGKLGIVLILSAGLLFLYRKKKKRTENEKQ